MPGPSDYLPRHLDGPLERALATSPVVILDGPRGSGKTTSARRLAASEVMLPRDAEALRVDPEGYLASLTPPVLVDEWQLAGTEILWVIKGLVDAEPAPGRFILTGSVEPATYGPTYPLTGRAVRLVMRPMTWAELEGHGATRTGLADLLDGTDTQLPMTPREAFDLGQLGRPGFPLARVLPDPHQFLEAYASLVSQRAGEEGRDATRLLRTMRVLAALTGQAAPDQRVWEAADVTKVTWKHYEDLLLRTHLYTPSPAMESNRLKRLTTYPKRFLADTALALSLADLDVADLRRDPTLAGPFLESYVVQQLRPLVDQRGGSLCHLRTGAGEREVDVVVELRDGVVAFEVKHGTRPGRQDARQLDWLRGQLGERFLRGYVVHTGADAYALGERVWAVPLGAALAPTLVP